MLLLKKQYTFDPINQLLLLIKETILPPHQIVFLPTLSLKNILEVKLLIQKRLLKKLVKFIIINTIILNQSLKAPRKKFV